MVSRISRSVMILAFILNPCAVRSEDGSLPENLLGFLKPGMRVGVLSVEGTTGVLIDVYTEEDYQIACDGVSLGRGLGAATSLVERYPAAKEKLDAFVTQLREKSPEANADDVRIVGVNSRQWFGAISAVGKDYVLIDQEGATKHRRVLAGSAIARIDLDAEPVHFYYRPSPDASNAPVTSGDIPAKYIMYAEAIIKRYDRNNDGVLTADEWTKMNTDNSSADVHKDGRITSQELGAIFFATK